MTAPVEAPVAGIRSSKTANVKLKVHPVILAGGSGTRLWPMSREQYPKQLIGLLGDDSLLQSTTRRLDGLDAGYPLADQLVVVSNEEHRFTTAEQLRTSGKASRLILEPVGRDTAPALTVAALSIVAQDQDGVMVVMPADHAVADTARFHAAVSAGVRQAEAGHIVTMGIVPTRAETGYGYIRVGAPVANAGARRHRRGRPAEGSPARPLRRKAPPRTRAALCQLGRVLVEQRHLHHASIDMAEGDPALPAGDPCRLYRGACGRQVRW